MWWTIKVVVVVWRRWLGHVFLLDPRRVRRLDFLLSGVYKKEVIRI
jgi:hypothetical protein